MESPACAPPFLWRVEHDDDRGRTFTLRPLTARLYAERARERVSGPPLSTDEEVHTFYLASQAW